jgi:hypothetical protein
MKRFPSLLRDALPRNRQRDTWVSVSPCWPSWKSLSSSLVVEPCTTWLTWTDGLTNIRTEGGPERKQHGP